jgi:hypothetical protein
LSRARAIFSASPMMRVMICGMRSAGLITRSDL